MVKVFIDPGHGGTDPGAVGNGLREKDLTLTISKRIEAILKTEYNNVEVKLSRTNDATLSLTQRTNAANAWGANFLLSVHINAGGGTGYEDFIYTTVGAPTTTYQNVIHAEIMAQIVEVRDRGKKRANYHMLRESKMPALLTENLFIDTAADAAKLKDAAFIEKVARGHAVGIAKAFNLSKKQAAVSKPAPANPSSTLYKVQIGAFSKKANADALVKQAKGKKFDAFAVKVGGLYKVQLGAFSNESNAKALAEKAKKAGYTPYIAKEAK
ncbi:N-acetylmuramoyl-L-alanine amidase [Cytobacillus purgationiresistens]|uniref:N-acetylmuramoyl-L-alanine amidase n=1 Tax=Cytobacillus purgationiresistens TaxID=863449 RepID=A0ABU0AIW7_9BACI|nr:N-acetylmuramoyl-L-alanine amidase [Cytobacillus purgationiresistens]MDQ0270712.1 N-acetylmuramoyl-L-alanine amidase [Cytobacillus purgationiresistens]